MRTLVQTLQDHDSGFLRIVAELWGVEFQSGSPAEELSAAMLAAVGELSLPQGAQHTLEHLQWAGGQLAFEDFARRFGPLREMGAGRRDRLKPWRDPVSTLEVLWYRGLIGRAFADSRDGPREFAYIPADLLSRLPAVEAAGEGPPGNPAPEPRDYVPASSSAVDDATTLLADLRIRPALSSDERADSTQEFLRQPQAVDLLLSLLAEIDGVPERTRAFLQTARGSALKQLQTDWTRSERWNDLAQIDSLRVPDGDWPNDPLAGRSAVLRLMSLVPADRWWSITEFIQAARADHPAFLRSPGGFDAWYIQRASDGEFLRGFEHWEAVEGEYLRYIVTGPLHWLGELDINDDRSAFRRKPETPLMQDDSAGDATIRPDGRIRISRHADRALRYQIARMTSWTGRDSGAYHYRLSGRALQRAERQGLTAANLRTVLNDAISGKPPSGILQSLERWASRGPEAQMQQQLILRVANSEVLDRLSQDRSTRRLIQERLGENQAAVNSGDWKSLRQAALKLGLLISGADADARSDPPERI